MKTAVKDEIKNEMLKQIVHFENLLFVRKWKVDDRMRELAQNIVNMVDTYEKYGIDDYDLWVFVQYRQGKMRSKNSCIKKLDPITLINVIAEGIEIPDDATMIDIEIKPVMKKNYNRTVSEVSLYSVKFGLGNGEELTLEQLKRRYGLTAKDNLYSVEDMKSGKILKFFNRKKREKAIRKAQEVSLGV